MSRPAAPGGLGVVGKRFWKGTLGAYDLSVGEIALLEQTCRTLDVLAQIDEALVGAPLTVEGSMGQIREHPLISEARQQRASLARLLKQLALPDEDALARARAETRSSSARAAAHARWGA